MTITTSLFEQVDTNTANPMGWRDLLPTVRGRYIFDAHLSEQTWFRVGGIADLLYKPADIDDLVLFLKHKPSDIPYCLLGAGSNVLVRDGGIRGIVIRLGRGFSAIECFENTIEIGAGALDRTVALTCAERGLGGLEFLVGVPGTIGGAIKMNAGCYQLEVKDILEWADILDSSGHLTRRTPEDMEMSYRHTNLGPQDIVVKASFRHFSVNAAEALNRIKSLLAEREESQPIRGRTGGSTFRNPEMYKAWQLIDLAGCRGLQIGEAQVSTKHCNFLLNIGNAKAADLELLGNTVLKKVKDTSGIDLQWEIIRLGELV